MSDRQVVNLHDLELQRVAAHDGVGEILWRRVFHQHDFQGPWNFVDYAVLPPGTSIGRHQHESDEELYLVLEGEGLMELDGNEFPVRPGSVILNRPHGTHGLRNVSTSAIRIFVVEVRA
ncbi:MAG: cupin domain-containing protein [Planctomycetota bacterium]